MISIFKVPLIFLVLIFFIPKDDTAKKLIDSYKKSDYLVFFKSFPDTYNLFMDLYGFNDVKGGHILYKNYDEHITFLFSRKDKRVTDKIFYTKIFELSKNGIWSADAPTLLQDGIVEILDKDFKKFISLISKKPNKELHGFWHFIFDGSSKYDKQNKELFEKIFGRLKKLDANQSKILKEEFKKMYG